MYYVVNVYKLVVMRYTRNTHHKIDVRGQCKLNTPVPLGKDTHSLIQPILIEHLPCITIVLINTESINVLRTE